MKPRPELLAALIQQESGGNPNAVSNKGARGLGQVMPATGRDPGYGVTPLRDSSPRENFRFTRDYLGALLDEFNGDEKLAVAAYNSGAGAVNAHKGIPPFPETQKYVKNIFSKLNPISEAQASEDAYIPTRAEWKAQKTQGKIPSRSEWKAQKTQGWEGSTGHIAPQEQYEGRPIDEMGALSKFLIGTGNKAIQLKQGLQQMSGIGDKQLLEKDIQESRDLEKELGKSASGKAGNVFGSVAPAFITGGSSLPALAASGAAFGALEPTIGNESRVKNTLGSMAGGVAGFGAGKLIGGAIKGFTPSKDAQALMKEGIQPTLGQGIEQGVLGKGIRKMEEAASSIPLLGAIPKHARDRAIKEWTDVVIKRAEVPSLGITAKGAIGHDAVANLSDSIGEAYNKLYKNKAVNLNENTGSLIADKINNPEILLNYEERKGLIDAVGSVLRKITRNDKGLFDAEDVHRVQSKIGEMAANEQGAKRKALFDAQKTLRKELNDALPVADQGTVKQLNQANSNYMRIEKAANTVGAQNGEFSPAQLYNAVKQTDISKRKGNFSKGRALMQDIAGKGKNVLSDKLGESGTSPRALFNSLLSGAQGAAAIVAPAQTATLGAGMLLGSARPAQKALLGGYKIQGKIGKKLPSQASKSFAALIRGQQEK